MQTKPVAILWTLALEKNFGWTKQILLEGLGEFKLVQLDSVFDLVSFSKFRNLNFKMPTIILTHKIITVLSILTVEKSKTRNFYLKR